MVAPTSQALLYWNPLIALRSASKFAAMASGEQTSTNATMGTCKTTTAAQTNAQWSSVSSATTDSQACALKVFLLRLRSQKLHLQTSLFCSSAKMFYFEMQVNAMLFFVNDLFCRCYQHRQLRVSITGPLPKYIFKFSPYEVEPLTPTRNSRN